MKNKTKMDDSKYWSKPENRLLYEWNLLWTSENIWERTPKQTKRRDVKLRKLFRAFLRDYTTLVRLQGR
jgi:hypothetical protein